MSAVHIHTEALARFGEAWRWMSAEAGASGDWVLASKIRLLTPELDI